MQSRRVVVVARVELVDIRRIAVCNANIIITIHHGTNAATNDNARSI